ncbi:hypothetical protein [Roseibium salinum]|uniref:Uncharacterized protein n=1 Tax=Roseibium salinum TaxID=1604349 RepID=A0ABT3R4U1_9HYPH|nr:hypothetical protein [Roseibium sp. DSM 29163]MCX2724088.1 hypothetical protein [Roseibium sp. DSM 29163]
MAILKQILKERQTFFMKAPLFQKITADLLRRVRKRQTTNADLFRKVSTVSSLLNVARTSEIMQCDADDASPPNQSGAGTSSFGVLA